MSDEQTSLAVELEKAHPLVKQFIADNVIAMTQLQRYAVVGDQTKQIGDGDKVSPKNPPTFQIRILHNNGSSTLSDIPLVKAGQ